MHIEMTHSVRCFIALNSLEISNIEYWIKNKTNVKKVATPKNFCLAFINELEKQLFIKKNCWSGPIKNVTISIFTMLSFFYKNKEKHLEILLFYTCVTKILMIWSTVPKI